MDVTVRSFLSLPLVDCNSDEMQQLYDMISRGRTVSESDQNYMQSIDWIDENPPAFENQILNWDDTIGDNMEAEAGVEGLDSMLNVKMDRCAGIEYEDILDDIMNMDNEDALKDVNNEGLTMPPTDELTDDHLEEFTFRIIDNYIKEESSRSNEVRSFWNHVLNDQSGDRSCGDVTSMLSSADSTDEVRKRHENSVDSYDSGGQSDSSGSSFEDDYSSPEPYGGNWFPTLPPIVVEPAELYSNDEAEAESEEVDIINFTDEQIEVFDTKTRRKMTALENLQSDHCYFSRVIDRSKSFQTTDSHKTIKHIPTPHKSKCSRSASINKRTQPRGQKNREKCAQRKLTESSRTISSAKRHARGRILKNAVEKRQQLNHMERLRRGGLKSDFQRLRLAIPQLSSNPKAPKDMILQCAVTNICALEETYMLHEQELARITKEHNVLRRSLKQCTGVALKRSRM